MYPNQTQYAPPMPQYPQQPAAPQYPPQYPAAPQYPQQPQAYPQGYAQPYAPPAPPAVPLPTGTLDSFYEQPSAGGGPSFKFMDANRQPQIGKTYAGLVARPVTNADVRAQADQSGRPMTYKDGRPKFVLVVPMLVQPSAEFPEGQAGWWVKGQARDELARAMAEAGAPAGPPEAGAGITVTLVGTRPVPGMNPAYQYRVTYMRPQGAAAAPAQPVMTAPVVSTATGEPVVYQQPVMTAPVVSTATGEPVVYQQPVPQYVPSAVAAPVAQPMPAPAATAPVAAVPTAAPTGFSEEQAALFARLTGGQPQG